MRKFYVAICILFMPGHDECVGYQPKYEAQYQIVQECNISFLHITPTPDDVLWVDLHLIELENRPIALQTMYQIMRSKYNEISNNIKAGDIINSDIGTEKERLSLKSVPNVLDVEYILKNIHYLESLPITFIQESLSKLREFTESNNIVSSTEILEFTEKYINKAKNWPSSSICSLAFPYANPGDTDFASIYPEIFIYAYAAYTNMMTMHSQLLELNKERSMIFNKTRWDHEKIKQEKLDTYWKNLEIKKNIYVWRLNDILRSASESIDYSIDSFKKNLFEVTLCVINSSVTKTDSNANINMCKVIESNQLNKKTAVETAIETISMQGIKKEETEKLTVDNVLELNRILRRIQTLSLTVARIINGLNRSVIDPVISQNFVKEMFIQNPEFLDNKQSVEIIYKDINKLFKDLNRAAEVTYMLLPEVFLHEAYLRSISPNKCAWNISINMPEHYGISSGKDLINILNKLSRFTNLFVKYLKHSADKEVLQEFSKIAMEFLYITKNKLPFIDWHKDTSTTV